MMKSSRAVALGWALAATCALAFPCVPSAGAEVGVPDGYVYTKRILSDLTQACIAAGPGGSFVGQGPGFTGNGQSIVFASESGAERVVASGFNAISDCAYDVASDTLYVTDNALEAGGAVTGDTVFAIASASTTTGATALGLELVAAGSIPSAFGVAVDAAGDVYVSDSAGGDAGTVRKISGGSMSTFVSGGLNFPGGLAFDADGTLLVADSLAGFDSAIDRYDVAGGLVEVVSGPTFGHGSYDLHFNLDGSLLVTGAFAGDVVAVDPATGTPTTFVSGLTFATGLEVDELTGRVEILSSTFSFPDPAEEDLSIHRFTPTARLVAGKGSTKKTCVSRFYGVELVPAKPGKPAKDAICTDGAACDRDGKVNDECLFPLGFCVNVADEPPAECTASGLAAFELAKSKPESVEVAAAAAELQAAAPLAEPTCVFSDGMRVPVKIASSGKKKAGKAVVKIKATSTDAKPVKDVDTLKLVCVPVAP